MSRRGCYRYRRVRMNQPRQIMFSIIYQHGTFDGSSSFDHWRAPGGSNSDVPEWQKLEGSGCRSFDGMSTSQ